jgi:hypothetical protein
LVKLKGFKFSPSKTKSNCFTKKINILPPIFQINRLIIPNKNTIKILGIIFDKNLTWKPHIKYIKKETTLRSNVLKVLSMISYHILFGDPGPKHSFKFINHLKI